MRNKIDLFKPYYDSSEEKAVIKVLRSGWVGLGPEVCKFEEEFAGYIGTEYAIALSSCTDALTLALKLYGIKKDDEVIVPTLTFCSTAHAVIYNRATPVFVDVDRNTLTLDFEDVKNKITNKTRAIIPMHYGGYPIDIDELREIVGKNIKIVEDCAHACGAEINGIKCGNLGDMGAFSMHAVKNLAVGDGGMLTLNDKSLAERAHKLKWLGIDKSTWQRSSKRNYSWEYSINDIGYKCYMNDISASIGRIQLGKLNRMNNLRRDIADKYYKAFKSIGWIELPLSDTDKRKSAWHLYCIKCLKGNRNSLFDYLQKNNIIASVHYKPIHLYNCYGLSLPDNMFPVAMRAFNKIISLPMHPALTNAEINRVAKTVIEWGKINKL